MTERKDGNVCPLIKRFNLTYPEELNLPSAEDFPIELSLDNSGCKLSLLAKPLFQITNIFSGSDLQKVKNSHPSGHNIQCRNRLCIRILPWGKEERDYVLRHEEVRHCLMVGGCNPETRLFG